MQRREEMPLTQKLFHDFSSKASECDDRVPPPAWIQLTHRQQQTVMMRAGEKGRDRQRKRTSTLLSIKTPNPMNNSTGEQAGISPCNMPLSATATAKRLYSRAEHSYRSVERVRKREIEIPNDYWCITVSDHYVK